VAPEDSTRSDSNSRRPPRSPHLRKCARGPLLRWQTARRRHRGIRIRAGAKLALPEGVGGMTWRCGHGKRSGFAPTHVGRRQQVARGRERTCEAISLRRHCPDQVDGGRRLVFQLAGLSAFRLPRPSRRPPSIMHPLGRGHQGPRSHFFYDPVAVGRLGRVGHLTARHTRCVIAPRVPPPDGQSRSCWVHTRAGSRVGLFTAACAISLPWSVPACERSLMATERCDRTDFPIEMCHCPDQRHQVDLGPRPDPTATQSLYVGGVIGDGDVILGGVWEQEKSSLIPPRYQRTSGLPADWQLDGLITVSEQGPTGRRSCKRRG